ncbi:MAG: phage tail sheath subtilisin-like domain-containing protein [Alphaproteobacteria bacterium]|nr:phage tail sheath subtilisin-like domain-containing protein [Alphaproteobacteria bacterium]
MSVPFHHGTRVIQSGTDAVLVQLGDSSVVGILGTAPDASATDFPLNTPTLITNPTQAVALGDSGTLKENLDTIFDQAITKVVVIRVEEGADADELLANAIGSSTSLTGINAFLKATAAGLPKPKLLLAPGLGAATPSDGVASVAVTAGGTGYSDATTLAIAGDAGSDAEIEPVIVDGVITAVNVVKPGAGYTGTLTVTPANAGGGTGATFTGTIGTVMSGLVAEAISVAEKLRAVFFADGPDGTDSQAVAAAQLVGSKRVAYCDPRVLKSIAGVSTPMPSSAVFVGAQVAADKSRGVHWTGSNRQIAGIIGTNRAITYGEQSDYLNENRVNTIINRGRGFRTWGVWTCAAESVWQFINVVRTTDAINEAVEDAFHEFVDRPMTRANLDFAVWSGLQALQNFEKDQMILPGSIFKLADGNTPTTGAAGIIKFLMAFEVPAPMADIRIDSHRNIQIGYSLLFNSVTGEINVAAL